MDRKIFYHDRTRSNECWKGAETDVTGHWEKKDRSVEKYFYVSGQKPSTLKNSFVVSKDEAEMGIIPSNREYDRYGLNDLN